MNNLKFLSIFLLLFYINTSAQTDNYPKGAYMSIEEIKEKKPTQNYILDIEKRKLSDIKMIGGNDYKLISNDKSVKKNILKKEIIAYSKKDSLYINGLPYKIQSWYAKVESVGKLFILKGGLSMDSKLRKQQLNQKDSSYNQFGAIGGAIGGAKLAQLRFLYALNLDTNEMIYITKESLLGIINDNSVLVEKFRKEENKDNVEILYKYLIDFNERN